MNATMKLTNVARSPGDPTVISTGPSAKGLSDDLGKKLGLFSIGLGLVELLGARTVARALGMQGQETLVRAYGIREIASGLLCLSTETRTGIWSRVAGDGLDLGTLLIAYNAQNPKKHNVAGAMVAVAGITLLDLATAQALSMRHSRHRGQRRDYSDRSGFPGGPAAARGAAADFVVPNDMRSMPQVAAARGRVSVN